MSTGVGILGGICALLAIVASADHTAKRLSATNLIRTISDDTVSMIHRHMGGVEVTQPQAAGYGPADPGPGEQPDAPDDAWFIEFADAGWVQLIDTSVLLEASPPGSDMGARAPVGSFVMDYFVMDYEPVMWVSPSPPEADRHQIKHALRGFRIGRERAMLEDFGFGVVRLVDIALRALSPGVNDPNTANDVILHLGRVLLAAWHHPPLPRSRTLGERTLYLRPISHKDLIDASFTSIRAASDDPNVRSTMRRVVDLIYFEALRRRLPGPPGPPRADLGIGRDRHVRPGPVRPALLPAAVLHRAGSPPDVLARADRPAVAAHGRVPHPGHRHRRPAHLRRASPRARAALRTSGVDPDHRDVVHSALSDALADALGDEWTPARAVAWDRLFQLVTADMMETPDDGPAHDGPAHDEAAHDEAADDDHHRRTPAGNRSGIGRLPGDRAPARGPGARRPGRGATRRRGGAPS